jgi:hypothetical protein
MTQSIIDQVTKPNLIPKFNIEETSIIDNDQNSKHSQLIKKKFQITRNFAQFTK